MIVLFTDFGLSGPYVGQLKAVLYKRAPGLPVIDLFADAPVHNIRANAYLLAAYSEGLTEGTVFLGVVDPGVGSQQRQPVALKADGRWFVGPDNGLFDIVCRRAERAELWRIDWRPERLSSSFHGRDLFAPVAAMIAMGDLSALTAITPAYDRLGQWPEELSEIIYIDHFGNLLTGIRAASMQLDACLYYRAKPIPWVNTFSDVPTGTPLCYENSNGLLEIAVNQGRADEHFKAKIGDELALVE
ncbi:MAG: SAM-dependent chlorinase/fluorinase [Chromatiales bacterium]|nr:SAM-dependent chlorinase/fluorinase [Chromatiales bacterium]